MAIAWAVALTTAVLGAELRGEAGARFETRSHTRDVRGAERETSLEVAAWPRLGAALVASGVELGARYAPVLRMPDVLTEAAMDAVHVAELRAQVRVTPLWSVLATAGAERGTTDLLAESRLHPTPGIQVLPTTAVLRYASVRADAVVEGSLDPRTRLALAAGGAAGGGDDAASRAILPIERRVTASAGLLWDATRRDVIGARGSGLASRVSGDRRGALATGLVIWRHRLDRQLEARAGGGAAVAWEDLPDQPPRRSLLPSGELGLAYAHDGLHLVTDAVARLGATADRLRGGVDRSVEGDLSVRWTPVPALSLQVRGAAAVVRQEGGDVRRGSAEFGVEWRALPWASLGVGAYGSWQETARVGSAQGTVVVPGFVEVGALAFVALEPLARR